MANAELLKQQLIQKAWEDEAFKQLLLSDPNAALKDAFGIDVPANLKLKALEETDNELYLVIPQKPSNTQLKSSNLDAAEDSSW
ncbi:NHLP leader peptide family RiPP precursor [Paenibacillus sp. MMS18-CY102]|uniref:NHLP leader peptide family RiPP precursor n=1 Tax=Paenibacillus sp. MMS18-CY102 TaxID=2682849 RepID=UPI001365AC32|nr:NHLP leader peptide family RiPP precursor [Paenibacillus sp. MMS18-CY102]MWC27844.1 NHLP leader peptide family natural product precursor [Paenibacillus sp. MMS18-CY102]